MHPLKQFCTFLHELLTQHANLFSIYQDCYTVCNINVLQSVCSVMNDDELANEQLQRKRAALNLCPMDYLCRTLGTVETLAAVLLTQMHTTHTHACAISHKCHVKNVGTCTYAATCIRTLSQPNGFSKTTGSAVVFRHENKRAQWRRLMTPAGTTHTSVELSEEELHISHIVKNT